jgi:tRNA G46 methylase TrmB
MGGDGAEPWGIRPSLYNSMPRSNYADRLHEFPDAAFADAAAFQYRGRWAEFFARRIGPRFDGRIILDIGCFDAGYLSGIAADHEQTAFIGIDWKCKAIYEGARHIATSEQRNIVLLRTRAQDLLNLFAPAELDEIWVFHPDPCDRDAERKNRLIKAEFLNDVQAVLRGRSSALILKTDHADYFQSVLALFQSDQRDPAGSLTEATPGGLAMAMSSTDYWNDKIALAHTSAHYFFQRTTLYEDRFIKKRKPIFLIELRKI